VAGSWNKALLDNSARPSGALVYSSDGANMSDTQFDRLKDELESAFQGSMNAGRPILLEGGLDWKPLSMSPKDMDFMEAKGMAAREIALAFGVPPLLLGLPGDNTYANYAEANRAFWRQSVLPLLNRTFGSIAHWLSPSFGADFRLEPDLDRIEALSTERAALWQRVDSASFLDRNEKRQAVGYGALEGVEADIAVVDMADEAGLDNPSVDDPEAEINKLKAKLYDLHIKYQGQPRDDAGRFSFGRGATSDPPPSSSSRPSKPTSSGNVQVALAPIQGIGWPSMNDASPQNAILSGDEVNVKPQLIQLEGEAQYKVNLQEEEDKRNGHAIREHVGKSDKELMSEVGEFETPNATLVHISEGSFGSIREAEDYTNMILAANKAEVDRVVREKDTGRTPISERLGFVTGREAYAQSFAGAIIPVMRPTFSVKVVITYAQNSPRGYRVVTSFPFNKSIDE
jgi:Phage portal protein/Bacterial CdiA-CT RNAse A domain